MSMQKSGTRQDLPDYVLLLRKRQPVLPKQLQMIVLFAVLRHPEMTFIIQEGNSVTIRRTGNIRIFRYFTVCFHFLH
jgi:hypothetical protein